MKNRLQRFLIPFAAILLVTFSFHANAAIVGITTTNAEGWVLENYTGGPTVVVWYSGAVCDNGSQNISIFSPAAGEINRLWSTVMAAKTTGAKIFVRYDTTNCNITSFGFA